MDWKLELVVVPTADVERAKKFYSDQLGFVVDHDTQVSADVRLVQLTPPGSGCSIAIGMSEMEPGSLKGLQLVVPDVEAARAQLVKTGVKVSPVQHHDGTGMVDGPGGPWNSFLFFDDPDGNSWAVQERPTG